MGPPEAGTANRATAVNWGERERDREPRGLEGGVLIGRASGGDQRSAISKHCDNCHEYVVAIITLDFNHYYFETSHHCHLASALHFTVKANEVSAVCAGGNLDEHTVE